MSQVRNTLHTLLAIQEKLKQNLVRKWVLKILKKMRKIPMI